MIASIAMLILNVIALIAILVARSELRVARSETSKALRAIESISSSRASARVDDLARSSLSSESRYS